MIFGDPLNEYEKQELLEAVHFWAPPKEYTRTIAKEIYLCFEKWKNFQADEKGEVETFAPLTLGLLASLPNGKRQAADTVEAWQCAGPYVHNEIDLAFKLWLDGYKPFEELFDKYGFTKVLALCGLLAAQEPSIRVASLIRLNGFLTKHLATFARIASDMAMENLAKASQRRKQDAALEKARLYSAERRRGKALELQAQMRRMAVEYFKSRPGDGIEEAVLHIKKYVPQSAASIRSKIKGTKAQALRSMNTARPK